MNSSAAIVVRHWIDAANERNIDRLAKLSSPDIEIVGPRGSGYGIALLSDWLNRAGLTLASRRTYERDGTVVVEQHGVWHSIEANEMVGEADVASRFRVEEGRVVAFERYDDLGTALAAAGLEESDETKAA